MILHRSLWIDALIEMLSQEMVTSNPNENVVQTLSTSICIEMSRNFTSTWEKLSELCEKFHQATSLAINRMFMIAILISSHKSCENMNSKLLESLLQGFLEKIASNLLEQSVTRDLMTFLTFLVCPRKTELHRLPVDKFNQDLLQNLICVSFSLESEDDHRTDLNFRLTCLMALQHISTHVAQDEYIR